MAVGVFGDLDNFVTTGDASDLIFSYSQFIPDRYDMHIGGIIYPLYNTNILIIPLFINTMFFEIGLGLVIMIIFNIAIEVAIIAYLLGKIKHELE